MISTSDLRKGVTIEFEGQPCSILDWQHVKIGRGGAIIRMKLRNLRTGSTIDRTCDAGDKFKRIYLDRSSVIYQYQDDDQYHFMDTSTYDDIVLTGEQLGDTKNYLIDNLELDLILLEGEPLSVEPPEKVVSGVTKLVAIFSQECTGIDAAIFRNYADFVGARAALRATSSAGCSLVVHHLCCYC